MADLDLDRIAQHRTELGVAGRRADGAGRSARRPPGRAVTTCATTGQAGGAVQDGERARRRAGAPARRPARAAQRADGAVGTAAAGLLDAIEPETAVEALDGKVPVALLPVRIETRFADAQHGPAHPHLPRPGAPRRPRAGVHRRRAGRRRVVLERAVAGARRRGASRAGVEHARRPLPSRPGRATCSTRCARPTSTARPTSRRRSPRPPRGPARGRGPSRPPPSPSGGWRSASRTPWRCSGSGRTGARSPRRRTVAGRPGDAPRRPAPMPASRRCRTPSAGRSIPTRRARPGCCSPSATATWRSVDRWRTVSPASSCSASTGR